MPIQPFCNVHLAKHTTFELGGIARYFFQARTNEQVEAAVRWATQAHVDLYVLGGGSNLVVADTGVPGLVLRMASTGIWIEDRGKIAILRANAGVAWDAVVQFAVARDLVGIECLSGIPGSVGASPIQNVGAYGQEVAQTVTRVTVYDLQECRRVTLERDDCQLGYRSSRFKNTEANRYVILSAEFELPRQPPAPPRHAELAAALANAGHLHPSAQNVRTAVIGLRERKGMLATSETMSQRSAGSFFVNPIVEADVAQQLIQSHDPAIPTFAMVDGRIKLSAGWLIEHAGLARGTRDANVGLSPYHCLVVVAHERATANDVVLFAHRIRATVKTRFGIVLEPEPNFWGFHQLDRGLPIPDERPPEALGSQSRPACAPST